MRNVFTVGASLLALALVLSGMDATAFHAGEPGPTPALIERFLASSGTSIASYHATRTLEAETRGGKMKAVLVAETSMDPARGFEFSVVKQAGSGTIIDKVLKPALEAERAMWLSGEADRGALLPRNYDFIVGDITSNGVVEVTLTPRRRDTLLLQGRMLLTEEAADLVRLEGLLVKRPSFWTRRVEVTREYARINGVRVPTAMRSVAQILIVGKSTFSMAYEYQSVNGAAVNETHTSAVRRGED